MRVRTDAAEHVREKRLEGFHLLVRFAGPEVGCDRFHGRDLPPKPASETNSKKFLSVPATFPGESKTNSKICLVPFPFKFRPAPLSDN